MEKVDYNKEVKQAIVDQLGCNESDVVDTAHLVADLGADSLDLVEIVMELEEEFGIDIPDSECETSPNVGELAALVKKLHN